MKNIWFKFNNSDFFKTYKQELLYIPLFFIGFVLFRNILISNSPNDAYFSLYSELETIALKLFRITINFAYLWIVIRVTLPHVYKTLHDKFYHGWDNISDDQKLDLSIKTLWVFLIAIAIMSI